MKTATLEVKALDRYIFLFILLILADWCGPCRMLAHVIEEIAEERADVTVGKLNISDHPDVAAHFGVTSIPTLIFFKDGVEQKRIVGARPKKAILAELE